MLIMLHLETSDSNFLEDCWHVHPIQQPVNRPKRDSNRNIERSISQKGVSSK